MQFRTVLTPQQAPADFKVDQDNLILTIGSCFADEVGRRLKQRFFNIEVNPAGTLFNPLSICAEINRALQWRVFTDDDVRLHPEGNKYVSFSRHSKFSTPSAAELVARLNGQLNELAENLKQCDMLMLTLGSARCFKLKSSGEVVANCHKFPANDFEVVDLEVEDIETAMSLTITALLQYNPKIKIVLTVSPVRHIGYGLTADRLSKSTLIVACHKLARQFSESVLYFPAYEALTDDLRDYRFYADDMVHPSAVAADYVMELWASTFLSASLQGQLNSWAKLYNNASNGSVAPTKIIAATERLNPTLLTLQRVKKLCNTSQNENSGLRNI